MKPVPLVRLVSLGLLVRQASLTLTAINSGMTDSSTSRMALPGHPNPQSAPSSVLSRFLVISVLSSLQLVQGRR